MRKALGIVAGLVLGVVITSIVEWISSRIYPLPPGVDPMDVEAMKGVIAQLPFGAFLMVLLAWGLGSLAGGWLAVTIARGTWILPAVLVGGILMLFGIITMLMLPHPLWFWPLGVGVY